jgi:hypothetical protein
MYANVCRHHILMGMKVSFSPLKIQRDLQQNSTLPKFPRVRIGSASRILMIGLDPARGHDR